MISPGAPKWVESALQMTYCTACFQKSLNAVAMHTNRNINCTARKTCFVTFMWHINRMRYSMFFVSLTGAGRSIFDRGGQPDLQISSSFAAFMLDH